MSHRYTSSQISHDVTALDCCRVDSDYVHALPAELMLIAGLWPRVAAATTMEFGRPTLERNHFRKLTKQSTHISVGIPGRSNTASRFFGTADVCCPLVEFRRERFPSSSVIVHRGTAGAGLFDRQGNRYEYTFRNRYGRYGGPANCRQ